MLIKIVTNNFAVILINISGIVNEMRLNFSIIVDELYLIVTLIRII